MGSLMPMLDARRRTDFGGYHDQPFSVYGGGNKHDDSNYHQSPSTVISPYANSHSHNSHQYYHTTNSSSSPITVDDDGGGGGSIEWKETPEAHIFKTHLPAGVRREDVRVQVEDDQVLKIIAGDTSEDRIRISRNWPSHPTEVVSRGNAKFLTALKLPEDARPQLINSYWENGVLTVRIPRRELVNYHHVRNVEISNNHYY